MKDQNKQIGRPSVYRDRIMDLMRDGKERTCGQVAAALGVTETKYVSYALVNAKTDGLLESRPSPGAGRVNLWALPGCLGQPTPIVELAKSTRTALEMAWNTRVLEPA